MSKKFINFTETGELCIEKVLFSSHEPIFFTARNEKNDLYLCLCNGVHDNIKKWTIVEVSAKTIIYLLQDKIHLREPFLDENKKRFSISLDKNSNYSIKTAAEVPDEWDSANSLFLPTEGEFMEVDGNEFDEEIEYYRECEINSIIDALYQIPTVLAEINYEAEKICDSIVSNFADVFASVDILFSKSIKTIDNIIIQSENIIDIVYDSSNEKKELLEFVISEKTNIVVTSIAA